MDGHEPPIFPWTAPRGRDSFCRLSFQPPPVRLVQACTLALLGSGACIDAFSETGAPLLKQVRAAPPAARPFVARLSIPVRYVECPVRSDTGLADPCEGRDIPALGPEWALVAGKVAQALEGAADPDALHAAAILDLLSGPPVKALDRSISYLEMASRIAPTADRFVDLSAAYLARANRDGDARSVVAALDAASKAIRADSANPAARFNLALAMSELGLFSGAREAFQASMATEPESDWASEARRYERGLVIDTVVIPSDSNLTPAGMAEFARLHSNEARGMAWERLARWGRAVLAGDAGEAKRQLDIVRAAGRAIEESHVDPSIADAVRAIDRAPVQRSLARAHLLFIDGQNAWRANQAVDAEKAYAEAARLGRESSALVGWAKYGMGNNRLALRDPVGAEAAMRRILASPAAVRYPALAARAYWALGVVLLRDKKFDEGSRAAMAAGDLYARLGEPEFQASMIGLAGETANQNGDSRAAYGHFREALLALRNWPLSTWRHNNLLLLSRTAAADGYTAAAEIIDREDGIASRAANRVQSVVESQLTRAQYSRALGDTASARAALTEGDRIATQLPAGSRRSQLEAELALAKVELTADVSDSTRRAIDRSIAHFDSIANFAKLLRAFLARAAWATRAGQLDQADADLDSALAIYEARHDDVTDATQRALLTRQALLVADVLTLLRVNRGDAAGALTARERSRGGGAATAEPGASVVVIELALIGDTLVGLTRRGDVIEGRATHVDAAGLLSAIEAVNIALERNAPRPHVDRLLARLHGVLLASVRDALASESSVTIIVDGPLSRAPFGALRDGKGRYFIETHSIRFASSFRQASLPRRPLGRPSRAVVVSSPIVDRRAYPGLASLPGADAEADLVASTLPASVVLRGKSADTTAVINALSKAELFHFAGHAVLDDARPERSVLAIGSRGLSAQSISQLRLDGLRLVVLSACETQRASAGGGAGFPGLADAFIRAGAGGVIGSAWKVDDTSTMRLMQALYRALARERDPALALREAQRSMLHLSPASWAAFRYAGS